MRVNGIIEKKILPRDNSLKIIWLQKSNKTQIVKLNANVSPAGGETNDYETS